MKPVVGRPVAAQVIVFFRRPKSHFTAKGNLKKGSPRHHLGRKDLDNCVKLALDGAAPYLPDDKIITALSAEKRWASETPGSGIHITFVSQHGASG